MVAVGRFLAEGWVGMLLICEPTRIFLNHRPFGPLPLQDTWPARVSDSTILGTTQVPRLLSPDSVHSPTLLESFLQPRRGMQDISSLAMWEDIVFDTCLEDCAGTNRQS